MRRRRTSRFHARDFAPLGWLALGASLGVAGYTLLDPQRGAARRAMLRDKAVSRARRIGKGARGRWLDAGKRVRGMAHEWKARWREREVADDKLEQRVRARIGRAVSHPAALQIKTLDGCVEISGAILAHEVAALRSALVGVRGVKGVFEQLDVYETPDGIPTLQ
jgi:hypothetical protein